MAFPSLLLMSDLSLAAPSASSVTESNFFSSASISGVCESFTQSYIYAHIHMAKRFSGFAIGSIRSYSRVYRASPICTFATESNYMHDLVRPY